MASTSCFEHRGSESVVVVPHLKECRERFESRLVELGFRRAASSESETEWRRNRFSVWWPVKISIEIAANDMVVASQMYLPWFTFLVPFVGIVIAAPFLPTEVIFGCAVTLGGAAIVVAAVPRLRRFDLSPGAYWQGLGRRVWGRRLETALREAHGGSRPTGGRESHNDGGSS